MQPIRSVHPFPAKMAPELAISALNSLDQKGVVLDPMVGSGTVIRQASSLGHKAIGFDLDPLAVLMTKVWTGKIDESSILRLATKVLSEANKLTGDVELSWIDHDEETRKFTEYWFAEAQRRDLRRIAYVLWQQSQLRSRGHTHTQLDVLRIALSRIIITKDQGASLARDVSHSRPHKVSNQSDFDVMSSFDRSVRQVCRILTTNPPSNKADIQIGDARSLRSIKNGAIDLVITSPPYLNAIDYMRGHRLSLVWFGHNLASLRHIRSNSVGAERGPDEERSAYLFKSIEASMGSTEELPSRYASMIARYAGDIYRIMSEIGRVLKPEGKAILVVGNSCLKGIFIRNSEGVATAASMVGLRLIRQIERELPVRRRYLPIPHDESGPLGKRMRTEAILEFVPV
jgi:hypothetical protein